MWIMITFLFVACATQTPKVSGPPITFYKGDDTRFEVKGSALEGFKFSEITLAKDRYPVLKNPIEGVTSNPFTQSIMGAIEDASEIAREKGYEAVYVKEIQKGTASSFAINRAAYFVKGFGLEFVAPQDQLLIDQLKKPGNLRRQWASQYIEQFRLESMKEQILTAFSEQPTNNNVFSFVSRNFDSLKNVNPEKLNNALKARMESKINKHTGYAISAAKLLLKNGDVDTVKNQLEIIRKKIKPEAKETQFHDEMTEYLAKNTN